MSGRSSSRFRGLALKLLMYVIGFTIFFLAGLSSSFYTNPSIEILLLLIAGIMGGDYFSTSEEERGKIRDRARSLGFVYTVGVALMLLNANPKFYSLSVPTAPVGYFVCIMTYLAFVVSSLQVEYEFKGSMKRTLAVLILAGVGTASLILSLSGTIELQINVTGIWLLVSAVLIGISAGLLTRTKPPSQHARPDVSLVPMQPREGKKLTQEELDYRNQVREALKEIRPKLDVLQPPDVIEFVVWNTEKPLRKQQLMGAYHQVVEDFSDKLNKRNDAARESPHATVKFAECTIKCIEAYRGVEASSFLG